MIENKDNPHGIAFWFYWEVHERLPDGNFSGKPKIKRNYHGALNFSNKEEAETVALKITEFLKKELKKISESPKGLESASSV